MGDQQEPARRPKRQYPTKPHLREHYGLMTEEPSAGDGSSGYCDDDEARAYMDQRDRDIKALEVEIKHQRVAMRDVLDLFVSPRNGRERKAEKYLRAALKEVSGE